MADNSDSSIVTKVMLSVVVVVFAIPGLIIEPGPFSEIAAFGVLVTIWLPGDEAQAVQEAT